jgi:hypothetical protein
MSLNDFYVETRHDLDRFLEDWKVSHEAEPDNYPIEMAPGDWHEQFLAFLSLEGK